jgi:hypothetical protein
MKRALMLGAALVCASTVLSAAFAAESGGGTTIINKSNYDIDHLFTSAPGKNTWGEDLMASAKEPIDAGMTEAVEKLQPGFYDFKMTDDDEPGGAPCIVKNVTVKAGKPLTLTKKMVKGCK